MNWYLVHTKPRKKDVLSKIYSGRDMGVIFQPCPQKKLRSGKLGVVEQALFSHYLFIRLGHGPTAQSWNPIRSTMGVSRLVTFGTQLQLR
jgi:transcriptional antiterminator RfaH